ncbi:caspase domain-containing uncharacterized protein [Candidatus Nitrosarchaeum limnium SFB1]|jgi:hypothetical protein|uniref:Caspase domain-containing uncharacterized protein n=1 Tax=Candidatus Nitrosarchaeum limnium SFB1 TaxID=886738 RepID=F3KKQ7_9ARCH|nr:caspase domain-containing uncharacterized protein [Candidatus Nitrosarchaeum limnium SFB1]
MARKKALVIAVSDYDVDSLRNLSFCKNDGDDMHKILKNLGYDIKNHEELIGYVDGTHMQDAIYDFFHDNIQLDDTLLFYFSGHGVPGNGDYFLASSNIDPKIPKKRGFSFEDLNGEIVNCHSAKKVIIIDSCYAGSAKVDAKGSVIAAAIDAKNHQDQSFEGVGTCLLSSCMGAQESFDSAEGNHSFFTNYLIKGLNGANGKSVDDNGLVTPESLMNYIDREIDAIPEENRPNQTPLRKIMNAGGPIEIAKFPEFAKHLSSKSEIISILKQKPSEQRSRAVGFIKNHSKISTAFLIGPNIIMTDRNVLPTKEIASSISIEFGDKTDNETLQMLEISQGISEPTNKSFELDPSNIFITSELGYSIVSTKGIPGNDYGWIKLSSYNDAKPESFVCSIYCDSHGKQIDEKSNHLNIDEGSFYNMIFDSEDMEMTTGAPIFDTNWNLFCMFLGDPLNPKIFEENTIFGIKRSKRKIKGIRIIAIEKELKSFCKENNKMACDVLKLSG